MNKDKPITCYRSGPIERNPAASFHIKNTLDSALKELGIEIIGDTFKFIKSQNLSEAVYGSTLKRLRNQGRFHEYNKKEILVKMSFRNVRKADFMIIKPSSEASGGTTGEITRSWFSGIPKLVIIGAHGENLLDNDSTFVIRMMTDRFALIFNTEKEVKDFIKKYFWIIKKGRKAIQELILQIKSYYPYINDRHKSLYDPKFDGKTVIIQGRPGCGKDTQGRLLQDFCGFKFFGSGHELRHLHAGFPNLKENLGGGNLAPSWIIINRITQKLIEVEKFEPIVFAGAPKMLIEAEILLNALDDLKRKPMVIVIDIDEDLAKERMEFRRNCDSCEISFCNLEVVKNPVCPQCGSALEIRPENATEENRNKILAWYKTEVKTVIKFFEEKRLVTHINGEGSKEEIFQNILTVLKNEL